MKAWVARPPESITLWVIYERQKDYPDGYVLRPQFSVRRFDGMERFGRIAEDHGPAVVIVSPSAWKAETAEALRAILPVGAFPIPRSAGDDPAIKEIFMDPR